MGFYISCGVWDLYFNTFLTNNYNSTNVGKVRNLKNIF